MITLSIRMKMKEAGIHHFRIETQLSPAWTTEWISEEGKRKLKEFGIAPPQGGTNEDLATAHPPCPQCGSRHTELVSSFGSTACKALFRCLDCKEPFDYFKCHWGLRVTGCGLRVAGLASEKSNSCAVLQILSSSIPSEILSRWEFRRWRWLAIIAALCFQFLFCKIKIDESSLGQYG